MSAALHPGQVLQENFLWPMNLLPSELALSIGVQPIVIISLVNTYTSVTPDIANKLSYRLGTSPQFWISLQENYDKSIVTYK